MKLRLFPIRSWRPSWLQSLPVLLAATLTLIVACVAGSPKDTPRHRWWAGFGPVIPHDNFPADCLLCHTGKDWNTLREDFEFDHEAETGVALVGAHQQAQCLRCHNDRGPTAQFAARGCAGCHEDIHQGLLGKECKQCHGEENWLPTGQIARHSKTRFPLVGVHAATPCFRCHPGSEVGIFTPTSVECESCHADDLQRANNPNHLQQGWVRDCDRCHIPTTWKGAGFNHSRWPLTGAHANLNCQRCHGSGVYRGTPRQCVACHLQDYQSTTNPDHQALGFPTQCRQCHNTQSWRGATFDHRFPINGGNHGGLDCRDCHTTPGNYTIFTCTDCHAHRKNDMDDEHDDVNGYVYQTAACYQCHPRGRE
ncbi:MAG: hypothetical protein DWQ01_03910 [Planctomycetota bacterium]|nr:MAG: hypothetical protein DWQ01_03910 [Planctomycetota bacterium]